MVTVMEVKKEERQTLGEIIKELRKERGLTQEEVARLGSLSASLINQLENGYKTTVNGATIVKLEKALKAKGKIFKTYYNQIMG